MALTQAIEQARQQRAGRVNRRRATVENARIEEISLVDTSMQLIRRFQEDDETSDQRFVRLAKAHNETLTNDEQRNSFYRLFAAWMQDEDEEERSVEAQAGNTDLTRRTMRSNNPIFLAGSFVPDGSDGVA